MGLLVLVREEVRCHEPSECMGGKECRNNTCTCPNGTTEYFFHAVDGITISGVCQPIIGIDKVLITFFFISPGKLMSVISSFRASNA